MKKKATKKKVQLGLAAKTAAAESLIQLAKKISEEFKWSGVFYILLEDGHVLGSMGGHADELDALTKLIREKSVERIDVEQKKGKRK